MTVKYLRNIQRQQLASAIASDPNVVSKYRAGYHECATEVTRYLSSAQNIGPEVKTRLVGHLSDCIQAQTTCNQQRGQLNVAHAQQPEVVKPLRVEIPQNNNFSPPASNSSGLLATSGRHIQRNSFTHAHNEQSVVTSSPVQTNVSGQFQIVPAGNMYNGPIAIYMGNVNQPNSPPQNSGSIPVFTLHVPSPNNTSVSSKQSSKHVDNLYVINNQVPKCQNGNDGHEISDKLWRPW